jgi:thioredoxin reductase
MEMEGEMTGGETERFDVAVVGGGPAGLSAALVLGRMRRSVLVLDTGAPAHAVSDGVHGFLGQDGTPPAELRALGREQLQQYRSVEVRSLAARLVRVAEDGAFEIALEDGRSVRAERLLLAHGMNYEIPELPGSAGLWGARVFHCPYCHGWEVRDRRVAVYGGTDRAVHQALLLASLSDDVVLIPEHGRTLSQDDADQLAAAGVAIEPRSLSQLAEHEGAVQARLEDGSALMRDAIFVQPKLSLASDLAEALGAELTDDGTIATDATGRSSIPGLYAAGDAATPVQSVAVATASGARAAYAINAELALSRPRTLA